MKRRVNIALTLFAAIAMVMTMSLAAFADAITSNDAALKKALKNAGLRKTEVTRVDVEYDREDDVYEVEFKKKSDGRKYDYEIAAAEGRIIKKSVDYKYKRNSSHRKVGKTEARKNVAKFSGISYKIICTGTCRYEYDDRQGTYEVKFKKGNRRYEYEVLAPTGKIIEYEWKVINR